MGSEGQFSPASRAWTYLALNPAFSAKLSWVIPPFNRRRATFFPNVVRREHGLGLVAAEGTTKSAMTTELPATRH